MKKVLVTKTANGKYYKVVSKARDGLPIYTPFFEVGDDGRGMDLAVTWARGHGYLVD